LLGFKTVFDFPSVSYEWIIYSDINLENKDYKKLACQISDLRQKRVVNNLL